jgi:hypothetical protein|tara:strand:- start:346 stop:531 length:186 start_codon:yes stop_codon:yes gene_type:complete
MTNEDSKINNNSTKKSLKKDKMESEITPNQNIDYSKEEGGPKGLEPTRYGDWEKAGRCSDF